VVAALDGRRGNRIGNSRGRCYVVIHSAENAERYAPPEIDTVLGVAREFPVLLNQIAVAQRKSLDDEKIIYQDKRQIEELKEELQNCLDGGPCAELKVTILAIMADVEPMIQAIERTDLLERFNAMKEKLV
jgi:hypothetical protein